MRYPHTRGEEPVLDFIELSPLHYELVCKQGADKPRKSSLTLMSSTFLFFALALRLSKPGDRGMAARFIVLMMLNFWSIRCVSGLSSSSLSVSIGLSHSAKYGSRKPGGVCPIGNVSATGPNAFRRSFWRHRMRLSFSSSMATNSSSKPTMSYEATGVFGAVTR